MNTKVVQYIFVWLLLLLGGIFSLVAGQYYYFDNGAMSFQQWCSESVAIKINMQWQQARAGRFHLILNTGHFSYSTSDIASVLRTSLFQEGTVPFADRSSSNSPSRKPGSNHTILQVDRKNDLTNYAGNGAVYGTIIWLVPLFKTSTYTGELVMEYLSWSATTETTLSAPGGYELINPTSQLPRITWYFTVQQAPCVADIVNPGYTVTVPTGWTKQSHLSGIFVSLTEDGWYSWPMYVPYVWTGGSIWTGNTRWISNQYGIDLFSFFMYVSGNGTGRYFYGSSFSIAPWSSLFATASGTTRQFLDRSYHLTISWSELFDYGIEKPITIVWTVRDRINRSTNFWPFTFNTAVGPWLITGSDSPAIAGATWISTTEPITLWIADDRAGVNSWSIRIILQWTWWTSYGPYIFSGSDLNLSGVRWDGTTPDQYITITNHPAFPYSSTILVIVQATDMAGTPDQINDYTFSTRPSCEDLWCCNMVSLQTGTNPPFVYSGTILSISGGINAHFSGNGNTGFLYCGTENEGMDIYKWTENQSGSAVHISFFNSPNLVISWAANVKAVLSGKTLYLQKIYVPPINPPWGWGWWWGGGWWITSKDDCELPSEYACANASGIDYSSSYYDKTCCSATGEIQETGHAVAPLECEIDYSPYADEVNEAFQRWYQLNITNKCPITAARLDDTILRKEVAKMMSMFTIQIIGIYPNTHKSWCDQYPDVKNLSEEMQFYTKTACQLDLMGQKPDGTTPDDIFNPNDSVDRAQFGTILSRLIYGDVYNIYEGEETIYKRYEKHLQALNNDGIMHKIDDPSMLEKRARVLLMLHRTSLGNIVQKYRLVAPAHNGALSLLENVR